jgi:hypothetical protein
MKHCTNHPGEEALSKCKGCGKYYCESCLTEGNKYYYCENPDCQELLFDDTPLEELPLDIVCPNCSEEVELSEEESAARKFHCPGCETFFDYTTNPPGVFPPQKFVHLLSSFNNADIAIIKSILDNSGVDYFFTGENFLLVDPLIQPAKLFVHESNLEDAKELLNDLDLTFLGVSNPDQD